MFTVLRQRDFAIFWVAALVSGLGDFILIAALPYYVYARSGSTVASALVLISEMAPMLIFSNVGGVFADRWRRKPVMVTCDISRGLTLLPLLAVHGPSTLWIVYLSGFLRAGFGNFAGPFGGAAMPHVVRSEDLPSANAAFSVATWVGVVVGSPIGGFLLLRSGLAGVALADGASFVIAGLLVMLVSVPLQSKPEVPRPAASARQVWRDWIEALGFIRGEPWIRMLFIVVLVAGLANAVSGTMRAPFIRHVLGGSPGFFALTLTLQGLGGIAAAAAAGFANRRMPTTRLLALSIVGLGGVTVIVGLVARDAVMLIGSVVAGFLILFLLTSLTTLVQTGPPPRMRGRIYGAYLTAYSLSSVLGAALGGILGQVLTIRLTWTIGGILTLAAGCIAVFAFVPNTTRFTEMMNTVTPEAVAEQE